MKRVHRMVNAKGTNGVWTPGEEETSGGPARGSCTFRFAQGRFLLRLDLLFIS